MCKSIGFLFTQYIFQYLSYDYTVPQMFGNLSGQNIAKN
jgi:hypothetical protein